jgi:hypothetical protein
VVSKTIMRSTPLLKEKKLVKSPKVRVVKAALVTVSVVASKTNDPENVSPLVGGFVVSSVYVPPPV